MITMIPFRWRAEGQEWVWRGKAFHRRDSPRLPVAAAPPMDGILKGAQYD